MNEPSTVIKMSFVMLVGCATTPTTPTTPARPAPVAVIPPIVDRSIVFGQRVGPLSLGMTEAQLGAVGEHTRTDYGDDRVGYIFAKLGAHATLDHGVVIQVAPDAQDYATASGLHVLGPVAALDKEPAKLAKKREQNGIISWCFEDGTFVTSSTKDDPVCGAGTICDIVVGGCRP